MDAGGAREGYPNEVLVEGSADFDVTQGVRASLTLQDDRPQLTVGSKVARIVRSSPSLRILESHMERGERYLGRVTRVFADHFEATLTSSGD
jgi:hypothetical protein